MQIKLEKKVFLKALNKVQGIVERKHALAIIANVKIVAKSDAIELSTTDMDILMISSIPAEIIEEGIITVPAHLLCDIVKKLPDNSIIILIKSPDFEYVVLQSGASEFQLPYLPHEHFPSFEIGAMSGTLELNAKEFYKVIAATKHSVSSEEVRYYLNGIYFHIEQDSDSNDSWLIAVATDSHRMAIAKMLLSDAEYNISGIIVPKKAIHEISNLCEGLEGSIVVEFYLNKISVTSDNTRIISKLIDGKFPDYTKAIPANSDIKCVISSALLTSVVDLVTTVATDKTKSVRLHFSKDVLKVFANSTNNAFAIQEVMDMTYSHDLPIEIAFNSRYLMDILSVVQDSDIEFSLIASQSAVLIRSVRDSSLMFVLMPMQVAH